MAVTPGVLHPSPHFTQLHPLSRSALAARRRRRPAPAFPSIQLAGDCPKPPRSPPRGETPIPVPNFLYRALCSVNFTVAGARSRRSAVLARWPADLARFSSPELVPKVHLSLLKLAKDLARLKSPPRGQNGSPEFLLLARDLLTSVLPSLPMDSWPFPLHWVRRGALFPSALLRRPWSHPCSRLPQLRRPHRRGEERRRLQPSVFLWSDPLRPIQIEWLGPRDTASLTRVWHALARLSAPPTAAHPSRFVFPPSDLDRTARTPSDPFGPPSDPLRPILIERPRPQDIASRQRALTPWPACQCPSPLALGPLGQCALPLCRWHSLARLSALASSRARPRPQI
jgi:hypothetical protein